MRTILIIAQKCSWILLIFLGIGATAQTSVLDQYIDTAFSRNIVLRQKNISLEKAGYALQIAKGFYYPTVAFQAGYQTADGGRDIQLPIGDMLNGVYNTLNELTQSNKFPQLKNESINFLPANFYDAKIRTTVPIFNADISYNKKITEQQVIISAYEIDIYKRELVKNIKTAYFNYLAALHAIDIYKASLELAEEGKRVNEKLLANGKGLHAYVIRAEGEVEQMKSQITNAEQMAFNAKSWFNLLLNKPQDSFVDTGYNVENDVAGIAGLLTSEEKSAGREELKALKQVVTVNETVLQMNKAVYYPKLNGFVDLGSQSQNWKFNSQSRYYMLGLQMDVPIFAGNRNRNKIRQSSLDVKNAELNLEQTSQQFDLNVSTARNNLKSAWHTFHSSEKQLEAAETYQRLIERGYREGVNTYIETVDARSQLIRAKLAVTINRNRLLSSAAILEREAATYNLTATK
ncbi:TolC family protein [Pollutibacter soli]|uniref:TolC family protein n=1 Tax=Pollutibacter soli TaxID=3034157 RepID=UPI0030132597